MSDLLRVYGNRQIDLKAVTDSCNLKIIMKGGKLYKNIIEKGLKLYAAEGITTACDGAAIQEGKTGICN